MEVTNMDGHSNSKPASLKLGDKYYVVCDGVIVNADTPYFRLQDCIEFIASARERDRLELMLHKRLLKKILRKRCSPDLHDYNVVVEVML